MGDYKAIEDKLKEKVTSEDWLHIMGAAGSETLWVTFEDAKQAIRDARKEVAQIDEDCVQWWMDKYYSLLSEFQELFGVLELEEAEPLTVVPITSREEKKQ